MHEQSARRFMQVAERFKSNTMLDLQPTVLYALAAPSTPDEVVDEALERSEAGEKVTVSGPATVGAGPEKRRFSPTR
jgi:hypothetical protein